MRSSGRVALASISLFVQRHTTHPRSAPWKSQPAELVAQSYSTVSNAAPSAFADGGKSRLLSGKHPLITIQVRRSLQPRRPRLQPIGLPPQISIGFLQHPPTQP